jgi:hypothetical protein
VGPVEAPRHGCVRQPHGEDQVRAVQQGCGSEHPGEREEARRPGTAAGRTGRPVVRPVGEAPAVQPGDEPAEGEGRATAPRQGGEADGRDRDEHGQHRADGRDPPAEGPGEDEDADDDRKVLEQPDRALDGEGDAEELVRAGEDPERSRPVEVQEVPVGHVAGEHPLREGEHEALLHRRAVLQEQRSERERDEHGDHCQRSQRPAVPAAGTSGSTGTNRRRPVHDVGWRRRAHGGGVILGDAAGPWGAQRGATAGPSAPRRQPAARRRPVRPGPRPPSSPPPDPGPLGAHSYTPAHASGVLAQPRP